MGKFHFSPRQQPKTCSLDTVEPKWLCDESLKVLDGLSQSQDLNPMKHLFTNALNKTEKEWEKPPKSRCAQLNDLHPRRCFYKVLNNVLKDYLNSGNHGPNAKLLPQGCFARPLLQLPLVSARLWVFEKTCSIEWTGLDHIYMEYMEPSISIWNLYVLGYYPSIQ